MLSFVCTSGRYFDDIGTTGSWLCYDISMLEALYYRLKLLLLDNDACIGFDGDLDIVVDINGDIQVRHYTVISDYFDALYDLVCDYRASYKEDH